MVTLDKHNLLHRPSKGTVRFFPLPFFSFFQKSKPQDPPSRQLTMVLKKIQFWLRIRRFFENLTPRSIRSKTNFCRWVSLHGGSDSLGSQSPWGSDSLGSHSPWGLIHWGVNLLRGSDSLGSQSPGGSDSLGSQSPRSLLPWSFFLQNLKIE